MIDWDKIRLAGKGPDVKRRAESSEGKRLREIKLRQEHEIEQKRIEARVKLQEWELNRRYRFLMDKND